MIPSRRSYFEQNTITSQNDYFKELKGYNLDSGPPQEKVKQIKKNLEPVQKKDDDRTLLISHKNLDQKCPLSARRPIEYKPFLQNKRNSTSELKKSEETKILKSTKSFSIFHIFATTKDSKIQEVNSKPIKQVKSFSIYNLFGKKNPEEDSEDIEEFSKLLKINYGNIKNVINDDLVRECFIKFLKRHKNLEDLDFLIAVKKFKKEQSNNIVNHIFDTFIKRGSVEEINLDNTLKEKVIKDIREFNIEIKDTVEKLKTTLNECDSEITLSLKKNYIQGGTESFINSLEFKQYIDSKVKQYKNTLIKK